MALLEREDQLSELTELLDQAAEGRGSLVLISGEAGIGKSSLIGTFADRVRPHTTVFRGGCDPLATPRPLGPLLDMAADPDSGLDRLFATESEPYAIYAGFADRLRSTIRPTLVVVEDAHWADAASLDLLRFIGRRAANLHAVIAVTFRDDEISDSHALRVVLGDLARSPSTYRLVMAPLSVDAVASLAGDVVGAQQLHDLTGGNPFYVTEALASDQLVPTSVKDAVMARVLLLAPSTRKLVEATAISPGSIELDQAVALSAATRDAVRDAISAGALLAHGTTIRFRHELARVAVEESINPVIAVDLHRQMLSLLQSEDSPDLARVVHHAARAGEADIVAQVAPEAARAAVRRRSHQEAVDFYSLAIENAAILHPDEVALLRIERAQEYFVLDRTSDAHDDAQAGVDHFRDGGPSRNLGVALVALSRGLRGSETPITVQDAIDEAVSVFEAIDDREQLAGALFSSAWTKMLERRYAPASERSQRALDLALELGSPAAISRAQLAKGATELVTGDADLGIVTIEAARDVAAGAGLDSIETLIRSAIGSGAGEVRRYDVAIPCLQMAIESYQAHDEDYWAAYDTAWLARVAFEQGRWDEAAVLAEGSQPNRLGGAAISRLTAAGTLGRIRIRRGDPGGIQLLDDALRLKGTSWFQHRWPLHAGRAEFHWLSGKLDAAADAMVAPYQEALATDSSWARGETAFWMWMAGAIDHPPENVAEPFRLQMEGSFASAAAQWHTIGCPYEEALALAFSHDEDAMLRGLAIFDDLGAVPAARWLRRRLREAGSGPIPRGPRQSTRANPAGLTSRQLEVFELMCRGLSNSDIAEQLFISKRTVEHHVSAVMAKLGVDTRAQAIARSTNDDAQS